MLERYRAALRLRQAQGTTVVALVQAHAPTGVTAPLLTLRLVASGHGDEQVAATGLLEIFRRTGPAGAEVVELAVPAGPGVLRLRRRVLQVDSTAGPTELPIALLELLVPLPDLPAMLVLDLVCPAPDDLPRHAALAGTVAASARVEPAGAAP